MSKILKLEIRRAFINKKFLIALIIETIIMVLEFVTSTLGMINGTLSGNMDYPYSAYNCLITTSSWSIYKQLFLYTIVLIASYPYATSYYQDKKTGYIKNIVSRTDKKSYLKAKYISVFLSTSIVCLYSYLLDFLLTISVLPMLRLEMAANISGVFGNATLLDLQYAHPMLYYLVFVVASVIIVGVFSELGLVLTRFVHNVYILTFVPFISFFGMHAVTGFSDLATWNPYYMMDADQSNGVNIVNVIIFCVLGILVTYLTFYQMEKNSDEL